MIYRMIPKLVFALPSNASKMSSLFSILFRFEQKHPGVLDILKMATERDVKLGRLHYFCRGAMAYTFNILLPHFTRYVEWLSN